MSSAQRRRQVLAITSIITFCGFLDSFLLLPIIALYAAELGASLGTIGFIVGLYSITNTPANILFGRLIDRVGYRIPLIAGLAGDAVAMFLYSVCRLPLHLALIRALHGTTGGVVGPATMSAFAGQSTAGGKGKVMAGYGISIAAATLFGYGLSGFIATRFNYQAVFLFGALLLGLGTILGLLLPKERKDSVIKSKTRFQPAWVKPRELLSRRGLIVAYSAIFAQYFTFGSVVTLLPLHVKRLGMTASEVGMLLATFAIIFIIVQFPSGALSDRVGRRVTTAIGLSLGIISLLALPLLGSFPLLALAMAVYGAGYGMLFPSISALVAEHTTDRERGTATGIFHALLTAGVAIGAPVMGWVGGIVGVGLALLLTPAVMALALATSLSLLGRG